VFQHLPPLSMDPPSPTRRELILRGILDSRSAAPVRVLWRACEVQVHPLRHPSRTALLQNAFEEARPTRCGFQFGVEGVQEA